MNTRKTSRGNEPSVGSPQRLEDNTATLGGTDRVGMGKIHDCLTAAFME